ncbi:MAG: hypothetical protein ACM3NQ_10775 [Bacteroidales bacterium]
MSGKMNRWSAVLGWVVLMVVVWALFVPGGLSVGTFALLTVAGLFAVLAGSALWRAQRPAPSIRQERAVTDAADERGKVVGSRLGR